MRTARSASVLVGALALGLALTSFACGGGAPAAVAPTSPPDMDAGVAAPVATSPQTAETLPASWSDSMTKEQKVAYMSKNVVGRMGKTFKDYDAKMYADFSCKTCHGPNRQDPQAYLPHLKLQGDKLTAFAESPQIAKFMHEHVVPEMASAMGEPAYDAKTNTGFGCAGCHSIDK